MWGIDEEAEKWMRQVYDVLAHHRDLAYPSEELRQAILGDASEPGKQEKFERALGALVVIGAVDKDKVSTKNLTEYYVLLQEFNTSSWEPKGRV
jgi:hypothetical protein